MSDTPCSVAAAVLACVQAALQAAGRPAGVTMVAAGGLVVDDCCVGVLLVAPERIYRTIEPFPTEALADGQCEDTPIAVDVVVQLSRCVPVIDDRGNPPSTSEQEAAMSALLLDAAVVWNVLAGWGVLGEDSAGDPAWERANLSQLFLGAEGGCIAVESRVTLGIPQVTWCVDEG